MGDPYLPDGMEYSSPALASPRRGDHLWDDREQKLLPREMAVPI
jgi:hypothetical protein